MSCHPVNNDHRDHYHNTSLAQCPVIQLIMITGIIYIQPTFVVCVSWHTFNMVLNLAPYWKTLYIYIHLTPFDPVVHPSVRLAKSPLCLKALLLQPKVAALHLSYFLNKSVQTALLPAYVGSLVSKTGLLLPVLCVAFKLFQYSQLRG